MVERVRTVKVRKLVGWDKDRLVGKAKAVCTEKQNKEFIQHFPSASRCSAISRKSNGYLERQSMSLLTLLSFPVIPPALYIDHDATRYRIHLWSFGISCPTQVCSQLLVHSQTSHWWGDVRSRKGVSTVL